MNGPIIFNSEDDIDDEANIATQRRPRIIYDRVNYVELYGYHEFLNEFRISKATFGTLLRLVEEEISPSSQRNNAILAPSKLYLFPRYLATGSFLLTISDFTGISESSAYQYILQTCKAIAKHRPAFVSFPTNDTRRVVTGFYGRSIFPKVIGAIGCTHVKIQSPGGNSEENFRNNKGYFSINVQCICNPWLKITNIVSRWPGACHNQTIFDNSVIKRKFETGVIKGFLLGDDDYELKPYLMTPLLAAHTRSEQLYNESHTRTRNIIKRCFGVLKQRFPVLRKGITVNLQDTQSIVVACAIIYNICIDMHDELPNELCEDINDANVREDNFCNLVGSTRGRQERDRLIRNHFSNL